MCQIIIVKYKNMNSYGMRDLEMHGMNRAKSTYLWGPASFTRNSWPQENASSPQSLLNLSKLTLLRIACGR